MTSLQATDNLEVHPTRIVKVGGSLFEDSNLPEHFGMWVRAQPTAANILIAGGGKLVDEIRALDKRYALGDESAHWISIQAMSLTARLLADLLNCPVIRDCRDSPLPPVVVLDVWDFMRLDALGSNPLPASWTVTSDSIAARVAASLDAELVLLKSIPKQLSVDDAISNGIVDDHFRYVAEDVPSIRVDRLRDS